MAALARFADETGFDRDEVLERFALPGTWAELPAKVLQKYDGLLDRVSYYFPIVPSEDEDGWRATVAGFKLR